MGVDADPFALWTAAGLGTVAALQPGAFQAFLLNAALRRGPLRTAPLAFAPLLSDLPIAVVATTLSTSTPAEWLGLIGILGAAFTGWLGVSALVEAIGASAPAGDSSATTMTSGQGRTLTTEMLRGSLVNLLNPAPWAFWILVLGPLVADAWARTRLGAAGVVGAFYGAMIMWTVVVVIAFGALGRIGPRTARTLRLVSGAALIVFALLLAWRSIVGLASS